MARIVVPTKEVPLVVAAAAAQKGVEVRGQLEEAQEHQGYLVAPQATRVVDKGARVDVDQAKADGVQTKEGGVLTKAKVPLRGVLVE